MDDNQTQVSPEVFTTFEPPFFSFAQGFHVRHIATYQPAACAAEDETEAVLQRFPDFDQFPVKADGRIIGVLERNGGVKASRVGDCMCPLDESILVSAEEPLMRFLPLMAHPPYYRLVLEGTKISALVTRSDVLKLPVRLLGFALVTNLELVMKEVIETLLPDSTAWLALLSENRRGKVIDKKSQFEKKRVDPPLVELTDFCDKRDILKKQLKLTGIFRRDMERIEDLRNSLAHAGTFVTSEADLQKFIETMDKARHWTDELRNYLGNG